MLKGKVHGSPACAGKIRQQTPKVAKQEKKKTTTGQAKQQMQYNQCFVNVVPTFGKKKAPVSILICQKNKNNLHIPQQ
uniref:40S ribosomal protein S30 n=1 Tax=Lynx canadensis TaxID=61383 RepID=A0A667G3W7_LYNCA